MKSILRIAACASLVSLSGVCFADEVTDNLDTAKSAYEAGKYSESIQALDYAGSLIRQKKGEAVVKLLPPAPKGWIAEEGESESSGSAMMGGIVGAKRVYRRDGADGRVTIQIQSDSPLLQSYGMMFANPMLLTASGAKLETIKGQKCAVTFKNGGKNGDIKAVVDSRYMITIDGDELTRDELVSFAKAIDYSALSALK